MIPSFKFHLNNSILPKTATIGKYDGKHPSLTCATSAGKVFLHNPHEQPGEDSAAIRFLNINRKITALHAGRFREQDAGDSLLVGTQTNLLAYDVESNSDLFYKEVPDGVNAITLARIPPNQHQMAIIGGNCSIQGYTYDGTEGFWTVAGDNVSAVASGDVTGDGVDELIVGSDDYEIRCFQQEEVVCEVTETGKVLDLTPVQKKLYGYALDNGTVGVYQGKTRVWRVKSKHKPVSICAYDIDGDGQNELLIGWKNGKFEARRNENGEVVYKDTMASSVAYMQPVDYRLDGNEAVVCCSTEGEVRGYVAAAPGSTDPLLEESLNTEEKEVLRLSQKKAAFMAELAALEKNVKNMKSGDPSPGEISSSTKITTKIAVNEKTEECELVVETNNETVIKSVICFDYDAGIFEGESYIHFEPNPKSSVSIPLVPKKDISVKLYLKVMVGQRASSSSFHVFEPKITLPKFAMYKVVPHLPNIPSCVRFRKPECWQKLEQWIHSSFLIEGDAPPAGENKAFLYCFKSLRDGSSLSICLTSSVVEIRTPRMQIAVDLVQDMCSHFEIKELESTAEFPEEMEAFRDVLLKVDDYNAARLKLTVDMADESNQVKNLVIRAEDARILDDMKAMKQMYSELFTLNNQLIGDYQKRAANHQALLAALKQVNNMIQLAAGLRAGQAKACVIKACRNAVKDNNVHSLFHIIQSGTDDV